MERVTISDLLDDLADRLADKQPGQGVQIEFTEPMTSQDQQALVMILSIYVNRELLVIEDENPKIISILVC